jgi:hypothetical protein
MRTLTHMDIATYEYTIGDEDGENIVLKYGMRLGLYFVKFSDKDELDGWKYLHFGTDWRKAFEALATAQSLLTSIGYTKI